MPFEWTSAWRRSEKSASALTACALGTALRNADERARVVSANADTTLFYTTSTGSQPRRRDQLLLCANPLKHFRQRKCSTAPPRCFKLRSSICATTTTDLCRVASCWTADHR
uniref:(northern house mosquito) hypothetical protein n=1 Tax=Culex pipiens TaxID=7175 RepID=A0A8D8CT60_CULPI